FFHAGNRVPPWAWVVSAAFSLSVMNSDSRSSLAGLLFACLLLLAARRWLFPLWQGALLGSVLLVVVGLATLGDSVWAQRKLHGVADRMRSMVDFRGEGTYHSEESHYKGSNNRFRAVWWRNVLRETWQTNPAFGLGFGHDLAAGFLQEYYPESSVEEFTARSPHNIFITVFGRMGLVGLVPWFAICLAMLARTWRSLRHSENRPAWAQWCALWVLLVSATFGVVLEGPMGAVPFWVLLGLASVQNEVAATEKTASGAA
ncbi:MAG: O-antigen ligase family protein, partial [Candidatus Didemnitutus sp.]|nr:O-antigen ligase family protein [Candidatus Didemnitutus sp.]